MDNKIRVLIEKYINRDQVVDTIFGNITKKTGLIKKILSPLDNERGDIKYNANVIINELKKLGFDDNEIKQIRDCFIDNTKKAADFIIKKYKIDRKNLVKNNSSFGLYQFRYQSLEQKIEIEFNDIRRKNTHQDLIDIFK